MTISDPESDPVAATWASSADCAFHCTSDRRVSCNESPCVAGVSCEYPPGIACPLRPLSYVSLPAVPVRRGLRDASSPASPTPLELTNPMTLPARVPFG
jgi:hypothetical protein